MVDTSLEAYYQGASDAVSIFLQNRKIWVLGSKYHIWAFPKKTSIMTVTSSNFTIRKWLIPHWKRIDNTPHTLCQFLQHTCISGDWAQITIFGHFLENTTFGHNFVKTHDSKVVDTSLETY